MRDLLLLAMAVLLLTLPFINQPFHLDDRDFLNFARISIEQPKKLVLEEYTYLGYSYPMTEIPDPHGPLLTMYLSVMLRLGSGNNEALFHAAYLVFPLIGAVSMYFLARRFTRRPLAVALLMVFTPGFLVISHILMDNLPGLALSLAAAAFYVHGVDRGSWKLLAGSLVALILALLTAYQTMSIVPAMLLYGAMHRPLRFRSFMPFILMAAAGVAWFAVTYWMLRRFPSVIYRLRLGHFFSLAGDTSPGRMLQSRAILTFIGGASIFPLSVLILYLRKKIDILAGFIVLPPLITWAGFYFAGQGEMTLLQGLQVALLASAGFMLIYGLFTRTVPVLFGGTGNDRAGAAFLLVWFITALALYLKYDIPYVSVRHLLLLFPPLLLVFMHEAQEAWPNRHRWRELFIYLTLFFTLLAGVIAATADYRFASIYPRLAGELKDKYDGAGQVWIRGEFDFRYYLEQAGFQVLNDKSDVKPGDIVLYSDFASSVILAPWPRGTYQELFREAPPDGFPFRIMNRAAGAGFYGDPMGPLPLAWSQDPLDVVIVYQFEGKS